MIDVSGLVKQERKKKRKDGNKEKKAAVWCSADMAWPGGVDRCIFVTGKPRRAWHPCMGAWHGAWVGAWVHGMVGLHWGCCLLILGYLSL